MSKFWKDVSKMKPDVRYVYFSPTKILDLKCLINDDGTISPVSNLDVQFDSATTLANAWKSGTVVNDNGQRLSTKTKRATFSFQNDFFLNIGRRGQVKSLLSHAKMDLDSSKIGHESVISDQVTGIDMVEQVSLENAVGPPEMQALIDNPPSPIVTVQNSAPMQQWRASGEGTSAEAANRIRRKPCPGFDRTPFNEVILEREWEGIRNHFSPSNFKDDRCWSKNCEKDIFRPRRLCIECQKSKHTMWRIRLANLKKPVAPERRLLKAPNSKLSAEELRRKMILVRRQKAKAAQELLKNRRQIIALKKEVGRYRPESVNHQKAMRCMRQKLDDLNQKIDQPICKWKVDGEICAYQSTSIDLLVHHIEEVHVVAQLNANSAIDPYEREYVCEWEQCRRQKPFGKVQDLRKHLANHSGTAKTKVEAAMLTEQMTNSIRPPTGRRYSGGTKRQMLGLYTSRRMWRKTKAVNAAMPLPSLRSMIEWKNTGEIKSGVDYEVLAQMAKLAADHPELRHGLLAFDEVHVNPEFSIQQKSQLVFGHADNNFGEQATSALVFQYVSLFSKQRFAINVAYYGCHGLNTDVLESWLWDVMVALEGYNFRVHVLISDGAGINRSLRKTLVRKAEMYGYAIHEPYMIEHPLTSDPDARLFILSDPSHVVKLHRNCCYNRKMIYAFGERDCFKYPILWQHFRAVQDWQEKQQRVDRRLTDKHLDITQYEKMSVQLAVDVMSYPIHKVLCELDPVMWKYKLPNSTGTREYMQLGRELWMAMNNHQTFYNQDEATRVIQGLEYVSAALRDWKELVTDPKEFLTSETYEDMMLLAVGAPVFMRYVWTVLSKVVPGAGIKPRILSQDPLERTFGELRQRHGGTQAMNMKDLAYNLRSINSNRLNSFSFMP